MSWRLICFTKVHHHWTTIWENIVSLFLQHRTSKSKLDVMMSTSQASKNSENLRVPSYCHHMALLRDHSFYQSLNSRPSFLGVLGGIEGYPNFFMKVPLDMPKDHQTPAVKGVWWVYDMFFGGIQSYPWICWRWFLTSYDGKSPSFGRTCLELAPSIFSKLPCQSWCLDAWYMCCVSYLTSVVTCCHLNNNQILSSWKGKKLCEFRL